MFNLEAELWWYTFYKNNKNYHIFPKIDKKYFLILQQLETIIAY